MKANKRVKDPKNPIKYFFYFFVFLFCIIAASLCACSNLTRKAEKLASGIPFNYPGLRIETRSIRFENIKNNNPRIVCFGDSVTFGWNLSYDLSYPYILEKSLKDKYPGLKVINCGIGGNTINNAASRLKRDVISYNPHLVIINFGLNDGMLKTRAQSTAPAAQNDETIYYKNGSSYFLPQVNISDFDLKYREIINMLKDSSINILILGLSPITDSFPAEGDVDLRKKQKEIYLVYNDRISKIAEENSLDFLNIWEIFNLKGNLNEYIQSDGIHPDSAGLELISDSVSGYIIKNKVLND